MGLFSSKKETHVSSVVYNMAGDLTDRASYLKSVSINAILTKQRSLADSIQQGLMYGPNFNQKNFFKWARNNYTEGLPTAEITGDTLNNPSILASYIPAASDETIWVQSAVVDYADYNYWVEKYLSINHPNLVGSNYSADINNSNNEVTITTVDGRVFKFIVADLDKSARYIFARYNKIKNGSTGLWIPQEEKDLIYNSDSINKDGYNEVSTNTVNKNDTLKNTTTIYTYYNDNRPYESSVTENPTASQTNEKTTVYEKVVNMGAYQNSRQTYSIKYKLTVIEYQIKVPRKTQVETKTVDYTTVTINDVEIYKTVFKYKIETQNIIHADYGNTNVFIYKIGSGIPALDNLPVAPINEYEFFPVIPIRINNKFISEYPPFAKVKKAYKKVFSTKIESFIEELEDNESLEDIDFAFVQFGVLGNERDYAGKLYLYEFFKMLMQRQLYTKTDYAAYKAQRITENRKINDYNNWSESQYKLNRFGFGTPEPERITISAPRTSSIHIRASSDVFKHYDLKYNWTYIYETVRPGKGKNGAKPKDIWFKKGPDVRIPTSFDPDNRTVVNRFVPFSSGSVVYLYHQFENLKYRRLEIYDMYMMNLVYNNKSVNSTLLKAIETTADESEFFVPLHYPTLNKLTLIDQNQLATINRLIVFNSYKIVKKKWYQRSIFKILMVVVIAAVTVIMNPAMASQAIGIFGSNAAVGASFAAFGLTGMTAIMAGAVTNALGAMILSTIVSMVGESMFKGKWGAIIGTLVGFVVGQYANAYANTGTFAVNWGNILRADNLLKLTQTVTKAYQGYVQGDIQDMMSDLNSLQDKYREQTEKIEELTAELIGSGKGIIDPTLLTESTFNFINESSDSFLTRTLLSGSEIAELSNDMIEGFADLTLQLPDVFSK